MRSPCSADRIRRRSKRSAIVTLAGILEERRALLKDRLGKDEGALFEIANRYDLRHRKADG